MALRVVIPVAGMGTRLRPHTFTRPKVLLHVAGKPMLGHILDELKNYDVEEVTLVIGYLGDEVRKYVTKNFPFKFRFIEQQETLGLGHAIWLTAEGYRDGKNPLLIILGDTLFEADFAKILNSKESWIGVKQVEDPRRFGVIELEGDRIKAMVEKPPNPPTNLAIVGIYLLQDPALLYACLDEIVESNTRTAGEIQLTDALQRMIEKGSIIKPFEIDEWYDCGKRETLLDTNRRLLAKKTSPESKLLGQFPGCIINPPVALESGVILENSIIGPYVTLGEGAIVRDSIVSDSIIAPHAEVSSAILKGSLLADDAKVTGRAHELNVGATSEVILG